MNNNGVYLDNEILGRLANNITQKYNNSRGSFTSPYGYAMDLYKLQTPIKAGYYDLNSVPLGVLKDTDLSVMLHNWFLRGR